MTSLISKKRSLVLAVAVMAMAVPGVAFARNSFAEEVGNSSSRAQTAQEKRVDDTTSTDDDGNDSPKDRVMTAQNAGRERAAEAKARLESAQLKRCEAQEKAITNIMARIGDRGQKHLDLFTTISDRVQAFYAEKGYTLDNYDSLVADVNAKKEAAQAVVDEVQAADTDFACEGDNPRGVASGFKAALQEQIAALKEYRTAVKNLIVGVKSVQPAETTESADEGEGQEGERQ